MSPTAEAAEAPRHDSPPLRPRRPSPARIEANRRNALKSTGPKTDEGKRSSRLNAVKHGLTARVEVASNVFAEAEARRKARREALVAIHGIDDPWTLWAADMTAHASTQIDRAIRMIASARMEASARAASAETWNEDRIREVEKVAPRLQVDPDKTVARLVETPQGIDWMIGRWQVLAIASDDQGGWTDDQADEAFDLLRIPRDFREGDPGDCYRVWTGDQGGPIPFYEIARREVARLDVLRAHAVEIDEIRRLATVAEESDADPEIRRLLRYEAALHRRLRGHLAEVESRSLAHLDPALAPEVGPAEPPADAARNEPNPSRNEPNPATRSPTETKPIPPAKATEAPETPAKPAPRPENPARDHRKSRPDPARLREQRRRDLQIA